MAILDYINHPTVRLARQLQKCFETNGQGWLSQKFLQKHDPGMTSGWLVCIEKLAAIATASKEKTKMILI